MDKNALTRVLKDLFSEEEQLRTKLHAVEDTIHGLQSSCQHEWTFRCYYRGDSHYTCLICRGKKMED